MARRVPNPTRRSAETAPQQAERELSPAEDRWLDLVADIIVEELLNKEGQ
jgi:hypothetical protein